MNKELNADELLTNKVKLYVYINNKLDYSKRLKDLKDSISTLNESITQLEDSVLSNSNIINDLSYEEIDIDKNRIDYMKPLNDLFDIRRQIKDNQKEIIKLESVIQDNNEQIKALKIIISNS